MTKKEIDSGGKRVAKILVGFEGKSVGWSKTVLAVAGDMLSRYATLHGVHSRITVAKLKKLKRV